MPRFKRYIILPVLAVIIAAMTTVFAMAEETLYTYTAGGFEISSAQELNSSDYTYKDGVLKILSSKPMRIKNKKSSVTNDIIDMTEVSGPANITLAGVNISGVKKKKPAIELPGQDATITLSLAEGTENTLVGGTEHAGLEKASITYSEVAGSKYDPSCMEVFISSYLLINGKGTLIATGGAGAPGIGGRVGKPYSDMIIVYDATIIAHGGDGAAGIGGARRGCGGLLYLFNANVEAHGGKGGAGIGGGADLQRIDEPLLRIASYSSSLKANNSNVEAHGGDNAPGIGDGENSDGGGVLSMYDSMVYAFGGSGAPAIGSVMGEYDLEVDNTNWLAVSSDREVEKSIMCSQEYYPLSISCSESDKVFLDGKEMTRKLFLLGKSVYTVMPKGNYEVKIGEKTVYYCFDEQVGKFVETDSPDKYNLTGSLVNTTSTMELAEACVIVLLAAALVLVFVKYKKVTEKTDKKES